MFAQRLAQVAPSATLKMAAEAERLRREGVKVVDFSAGEPDFPTPEHVKAAGKDAIDQNFTRYTPAPGIPELREAICARYLNDYGVKSGCLSGFTSTATTTRSNRCALRSTISTCPFVSGSNEPGNTARRPLGGGPPAVLTG
jgi:aspartate/methionine/tyrosine aminotransferase